jgi:hypothetical protein
MGTIEIDDYWRIRCPHESNETSDGILCGNQGSRTVAEARREMERRSIIQISNWRNIGFRFCERSGDSKKCERKQYIPVWSAGYTAQYHAENCGAFAHGGRTFRSHKKCARHVVHTTYHRVIRIACAIAHDSGSIQQGRSGPGKQLQCVRADSPRGNETVFSETLRRRKYHQGHLDARRAERQ